MSELLTDLELIALETKQIANAFQVIACYGTDGVDSLVNFSDAISFIGSAAVDNAKKLNALVQEIVKTARQGTQRCSMETEVISCQL